MPTLRRRSFAPSNGSKKRLRSEVFSAGSTSCSRRAAVLLPGSPKKFPFKSSSRARAPVVIRYGERLEEALAKRGFQRRLYIMQSTGGSLTTGIVKKIPVQIIESGPAAGVLAAAHIGRITGQSKIISFDMGGTTAKAGLIENHEPRTVSRFQAGEWLLGVPSLDLIEIGSGGGSIAWIDGSGMLKVGPQSAGALPGPA